MPRLRAIVLSLLAILAIVSPSFAIGLGAGHDGCGVYVSVPSPGEPANLPSPCDLAGGKRVMPQGTEFAALRRMELPRATEAQWQFGLTSDRTREGRGPMTEPKPPRVA